MRHITALKIGGRKRDKLNWSAECERVGQVAQKAADGPRLPQRKPRLLSYFCHNGHLAGNIPAACP